MLKATAKLKCTQPRHNGFYVHKLHGKFYTNTRDTNWEFTRKKKKKKKKKNRLHHNFSHFHATVMWMSVWFRVWLWAGDLELLLPCGRHDKNSGWKTKARINLWIRAVQSDYLLFVRVLSYCYSEFQSWSDHFCKAWPTCYYKKALHAKL